MCRDAASCELELSTLEDVQKGFEAACLGGAGQEIYGPLVDAVGRTAAWLHGRAQRPDVRQQQESGQQRFEGVFGALEVLLCLCFDSHCSSSALCTGPAHQVCTCMQALWSLPLMLLLGLPGLATLVQPIRCTTLGMGFITWFLGN